MIVIQWLYLILSRTLILDYRPGFSILLKKDVKCAPLYILLYSILEATTEWLYNDVYTHVKWKTLLACVSNIVGPILFRNDEATRLSMVVGTGIICVDRSMHMFTVFDMPVSTSWWLNNVVAMLSWRLNNIVDNVVHAGQLKLFHSQGGS